MLTKYKINLMKEIKNQTCPSSYGYLLRIKSNELISKKYVTAQYIGRNSINFSIYDLRLTIRGEAELENYYKKRNHNIISCLVVPIIVSVISSVLTSFINILIK
ncbi:hypothetical protein DS830_02475 [Bombilactobacillus bombi]|nr:hypothetical protein DS830_02475 [Bombilactobacillus bombi]